MANIKNDICQEFESEMWLFAAAELPEERMEYWNTHLAGCSKCLTELEEELNAVAVIRESTMIELDNSTFNRMIDNAVKVKRSRIKDIIESIRHYKSGINFYGKTAFAGGLVTIIVVITLIMYRPAPVKSIPAELLDWEGTKINSEIKEISNHLDRFVSNKWDNEVSDISQRLTIIENKLNEF